MKIGDEMKNVVVITNPMIAANKSADVTLSKFLRVIKPSVDQIQVIGGNLSVEKDLKDIELISFPIVRHPNKLKRILSVIGIQLKMTKAINRIGKKGQPVYFWIADKMILPYFAAKMKGMEVKRRHPKWIHSIIRKTDSIYGIPRNICLHGKPIGKKRMVWPRCKKRESYSFVH